MITIVIFTVVTVGYDYYSEFYNSYNSYSQSVYEFFALRPLIHFDLSYVDFFPVIDSFMHWAFNIPRYTRCPVIFLKFL